MRIVVPLVIEMTDEQVSAYGVKVGLGNKPRAKDMVESVRAYVLTAVQDSPAFGLHYAAGVDPVGVPGADVSIKER